MTVTIFILVLTILISIQAMENSEMKYKMMFNPVFCWRDNQWYRVLSHALIHSNWMHLIFNMYVLYMFGEMVEKLFIANHNTSGRILFVVLYVGAGVFATLPSLINRKNDSAYFSLGASGAVSGIVFSFILFLPTAEMGIIFLPFYLPAYQFGLIYLVAEYFMSKKGRTGIAHDAHFAGAVFGIIFTLITNLESITHIWKTIL